jgi:hypothetical protein
VGLHFLLRLIEEASESTRETDMCCTCKMLDVICKFFGVDKDTPGVLWNVLESLLEALGRVLHLHEGGVNDLANVDGMDPAWELLVDLSVAFGVRLGRVTDGDELAFWEPGMDLPNAVNLVCLDILRERLKQAGKVHPGRIPEDHGARRVVSLQEGEQERIQVVWGC